MYALILAGGRGERLRPLTDLIPKPMVRICGQPVLWHHIQWLKRAGITDVVFMVGYKSDVVRDFFGGGSSFGFRAHYSVEETRLGRGGAIRKGMSFVPREEEYVLVMNGDVISHENPSSIISTYLTRRETYPAHAATIMVAPFTSPYGLVDIDSHGGIISFREKCELPYWINAGIYVFSDSIKFELPEIGETETFPKLAERGLLNAHYSENFWRSIDSLKDLKETENHLVLHGLAGSG